MTASSNKVAFDAWLAEADVTERRQPPVDELLAEHHVMTAVLAAMEAEAGRMLAGEPLRHAFWSDVVDFNGNFVHLCHRVKEEAHFIPILVEHGLLDAKQRQAVLHEHVSARDLTLGMCDGVGEGDWEKVLRLVSIYVHLLRPHMRREEAGMFAMARTALPANTVQDLRRSFDGVDRQALARGGRRHFAAIAVRLTAACGIVGEL